MHKLLKWFTFSHTHKAENIKMTTERLKRTLGACRLLNVPIMRLIHCYRVLLLLSQLTNKMARHSFSISALNRRNSSPVVPFELFR